MNCSQFNLSSSSVGVKCEAGFNGGLQQTFVMELYSEAGDGDLIANVTSEVRLKGGIYWKAYIVLTSMGWL